MSGLRQMYQYKYKNITQECALLTPLYYNTTTIIGFKSNFHLLLYPHTFWKNQEKT